MSRNKAHGKKFDAASKHFEKKRIQFQRTIDRLEERVREEESEKEKIIKKCHDLERENADLKARLEVARKYISLPEEALEEAVENEKSMRRIAPIVLSMVEECGMRLLS